MNQLIAMQMFIQIVESGSLTKAADVLNTSLPTVVRTLATLEKHLNIRAFDNKQKREAYERQKGICIVCKKHFDLNEMEADHIDPWHSGGKTDAKNCQMLCREDNRRKSGK